MKRLTLLAIVVIAMPALVSGQQDAFYEVQGIEYYYATGTYGSGHMTFGFQEDGAPQEDFAGCTWAKLRPDTNKGRVQLIGTYHGLPFLADMGRFPDQNTTPDALAAGLQLPIGPGAGAHVAANMGARGSAEVRFGNVPLADPVTGNETFAAAWFVSDGYRDDITGAVLRNGVPSQATKEMHLHISSNPDLPGQGPDEWQVTVPTGIPFMLPDNAYQAVYSIPNTRMTGAGSLSMAATTLAPAGQNQLNVSLYAPDGRLLHGFDIAPALLSDASEQVQFDLAEFGDYHVTVRGNVSLLQYTLSLTQTPPASFSMDFWWDEVLPGYAGLQARYLCSDLVAGAVNSGFIAPRADPPPFDWQTSLFTVAAGITVILVGTAIVLSARAISAARQSIRG